MQKITVSRWTSPWERDVYDVESFKFPGGELQVRIPGLPEYLDDVQVVARVQSSDDLVQLMMVDEIIGHQTAVGGTRTLVVPYFPYARQDRMTQRTEAFSLRPIARLLNETSFNNITIVDPHSDVTPALLDNVDVIHQDEVVKKFAEMQDFLLEDVVVVAPDAGAVKKARKIADAYGLDLLTASKVRDTVTGEITGTRIEGEERLIGKHAMIVDDICDGGRTFVELARMLRRVKAEASYLYVTHGIFSKGLDVFSGLIDAVFTTDSFASGVQPHPRIPLFVHELGFNAQGELA